MQLYAPGHAVSPVQAVPFHSPTTPGVGGLGTPLTSGHSSRLHSPLTPPPEPLSAKIAKCQQTGKFFWGIEFFPPKTDPGVLNLRDRILRLGQLRPTYVGITWGKEGSTADLTLQLSQLTQDVLGQEAMLHITCTNTPTNILESALSAAKARGIRNVLVLRGAPHLPVKGGAFQQSVDLVRYIRLKFEDHFCIAVSGHPEGFPETPYDVYLQHLREKVKAGADLIITQLVYDPSIFLKFAADCRALGITVPIICGIMPIHTYKNFTRVVKELKNVPVDLCAQIDAVKEDEEAVKDLGIRAVVGIINELRRNGVCGFHFFSLNLEKAIMSILDELGVLGDEQRKALPWRMSANPMRNSNEEIRPIFWANRSTSYLAKTMFWDEFPNGRWGDARSPAFGEIDHAMGSVLLSDKSRRAALGHPTCLQDIIDVFLKFLRGEIDGLPWFESPLQAESNRIRSMLERLNANGFLTINSQPRADGVRSDDPDVGWGPRGGYVYQKEYVEFFCSRNHMDILIEILPLFPSISFMCSDRTGQFTCGNVQTVNAVTWGVFPAKEIVQPTVVDPYSFQVWKTEAFELWLAPFTDNISAGEELPPVVKEIYDTWVLVTMVENDYKNGELSRVFEAVMGHWKFQQINKMASGNVMNGHGPGGNPATAKQPSGRGSVLKRYFPDEVPG